MRRTEDGFVIAEEDLRLRGGGELLGTRQSGSADVSALPRSPSIRRCSRRRAIKPGSRSDVIRS